MPEPHKDLVIRRHGAWKATAVLKAGGWFGCIEVDDVIVSNWREQETKAHALLGMATELREWSEQCVRLAEMLEAAARGEDPLTDRPS